MEQPAQPLADRRREEASPLNWSEFCTLCKITDKSGNVITFDPKPEQEQLIRERHNRNVILKARQLGMTTVIQLWFLYQCLFVPNTSAGVIAHSKEDAQAFFDNKIKFAYDNLPEALRREIPCSTDNKGQLKFSNGSSIRVGTSLRSSTLQLLHVSELGKVAATRPDKAREIISGALNAIASDDTVAFVESTAEGPYGAFYEICQMAESVKAEGVPLTPLDYKFFFFPWYTAEEYVLNTPVSIDNEHAEYFRKLEEEEGIKLSQPQQFWYVKKAQEQGALMMQEYPATSEEAFHVEQEGRIFGKQMRKARREGRICTVPHASGVPVETFWDLGRNDLMAIWFMQLIGFEKRFIHYHQDSGYDLSHYLANVLAPLARDRNYIYGEVYLPHDANVVELTRGDGKSRRDIVEDAGYSVTVVDRIDSISTGIEVTRQVMGSCWFDKANCEDGIKALEGYQFAKDEKNDTFRKIPLHNWASNGADAFRQMAQGYRADRGGRQPTVGNEQLARASRRGRSTARTRRTGTSNRV